MEDCVLASCSEALVDSPDGLPRLGTCRSHSDLSQQKSGSGAAKLLTTKLPAVFFMKGEQHILATWSLPGHCLYSQQGTEPSGASGKPRTDRKSVV